MNWLIKFINKVGVDKVVHALTCFIIAENVTLLVFNIRPYRGFNTFLGSAIVGVFVAYMVGVWKEWYDSRQKDNHADPQDIIADGVGCFAGAIIGAIMCLL